jgi:hypothetical protein
MHHVGLHVYKTRSYKTQWVQTACHISISTVQLQRWGMGFILSKKFTCRCYMLNIGHHKKMYAILFVNASLINVTYVIPTNIWYFF